MVMSVREALARVIDLFGPQASWDPTKLYGNLLLSPNGNVVLGSLTDNGTDKLQVNGTSRFYGNTIFGANISGVTANFTGLVYNSLVATGTGVFRTTGDNGIAWAGWTSGTASYQVDAANDGSAYMGVRWTHWGTRHLAAISGFAGGTGSSTCMIAFQFGTNATSHLFYDGGAATFAGALTQNSDYRIKTNVEAMDPAEVLARVLRLRPTEYDRTEDHHLHGRQAGFIAHEVQEIFPLLVKGVKNAMKKVKKLVGDLTPHQPGEEPEGYVPPVEQEVEEIDPQSVNYIGMVPYLTASIQALNAKLEARDDLIAKLVKRIEVLEAK